MGILRLLLALSVVFWHGDVHVLRLVNGGVAVQFFFVISGFYMSLVLNEKYMPSGPITWAALKTFFEARLFRLFPIYVVVLTLSLLTQCLWLKSGTLTNVLKDLPPALSYWVQYGTQTPTLGFLALGASNLLLFGQDAAMFTGFNSHSRSFFFTQNFWPLPIAGWHFLFVPQAWSLGIELVFYAIAPWLVRRRVRTIALWAVASLVLNLTLRKLHLPYDPWAQRFFPATLWLFLLGSLGYRVYRKAKENRTAPKVGAVALVLVGALLFFVGPNPGNWLLLSVCLLFGVCVPFIFILSKTNRVDRWIGELSYPLYLCHVLVIQAFAHAGIQSRTALVLTSLFLAVLLFLGIDLPFEKRRQNWVKRRAERPNVALS